MGSCAAPSAKGDDKFITTDYLQQCLYCRVSTADQSCERQEFDLRAFAGRAGYDVVGIFKETGSGTKLDRAERKKVLALAQSRQIDAILVTELSRWGRSTLDLLNTLRELENWKVSVIAMNGMAFDLSSPYGRMLATFLSGIAEFERDLISERVKSGLAVAKARGKRWSSGRVRPKSDRLLPKVVARAEDAAIAGSHASSVSARIPSLTSCNDTELTLRCHFALSRNRPFTAVNPSGFGMMLM
jgi:DNA invertase Pin-like site-specific DNA recombinase